jgi:hypothetical protein
VSREVKEPPKRATTPVGGKREDKVDKGKLVARYLIKHTE